MAILKMKACSIVGLPYDIDVATGNSERVSRVCLTLNDFCKTLSDSQKCVKLFECLEDEKNYDELVHRLSALSCFSERQALSFVENLKMLSEGNYVYVHEDTFVTSDAVQI